MNGLLLLCALTLAAAPGGAPSARPEVLVLGVYHMGNPGRDVFNTQADDVLTPKRQAEMAELITVLKRFRPTKIAVEADVGSQRIARRFSDYVAGRDTLTRNEVDQIGFRLAKELGHSAVYPVDVEGDFPWPRFTNYAKGSGHAADLDTIMAEVGGMVRAQNEYLASHSILETLLLINSDDRVARDMGYYYRDTHFGESGDWAGADLVADWFRRNIRIHTHVTQLVDSPNERVLVIFGSGHLGWLRQNVVNDPDLRLRKLAEFVK